MFFLRMLRTLSCVPRVFSTSTSTSASASVSSFSATEFRRFPITQITNLNHDTKLLRMALKTPSSSTGLNVSSLVMVKGEGDDARPYTPITLKEDLGYFELLVKTYPLGTVSSFLHKLQGGRRVFVVVDKVAVKGPFPKLAYTPNMKKNVCMLAGGSGITPCLQVIKEVIRLKSEGDNTKIRLIYANRKEEDILLRELLDELSEANENVSVEYMLSQPTDTWKGLQGRLNTSVLEKRLPGPSPDTLVYVCGPPGFMETVSGDKLPNKDQGPVGGALRELGYTSNMVYKF